MDTGIEVREAVGFSTEFASDDGVFRIDSSEGARCRYEVAFTFGATAGCAELAEGTG